MFHPPATASALVPLKWNSTTAQLHGDQGERHSRVWTGRFGALELGLGASDTCNLSGIFGFKASLLS